MYQRRSIETFYNHKNYRTRFHILNREPRCYLRIYESAIICTMLAVIGVSMLWGFSIRILSTDLHDGFAAVQLAFHQRNVQHLSKMEQRILHDDWKRIFKDGDGDYQFQSSTNGEDMKSEMLIMSHGSTTIDPATNVVASHSAKSEEGINRNISSEDTARHNLEMDRKFLTHMSIDIYQSRWEHNMAVQFLYGFSYISEAVGILWGVMSFIFHTDFKKFWGVPQPWCIVLPSILVFSIMTVINLCYVVLAEIYIKSLCYELRKDLLQPNLISCGDAISLLRPILHSRSGKYDFYLKLYRLAYSGSFILWLSALMIIVSRCFLAVDFKIIDIIDTELGHELQEEFRRSHSSEADFVEIPLNSPTKNSTQSVSVGHQCRRSEDDFQSAKSHTSEVETPLLEQNNSLVENNS